MMQGSALGNSRTITVFAPASVGNVAVGFDVMGHAVSGIGDTVEVERVDKPTIKVVEVSGCLKKLPTSPKGNTAAAAIKAMSDELGLESGFEIRINKGIPVGSGMGGSAASAVGAVVALNAMLKIPLPIESLYPFALAGEAVASGSAHGDNVAASLMGGLAIVGPNERPQVISIPAPNQLRCVLVHPSHKIATRDARACLPKQVDLSTVVAQSANMAAVIAACFQRDLDLIGRALRDLLIEPHRSDMIPGFDDVRAAAVTQGALGCSISGAGPSMFAWFSSETAAERGREAMVAAFEAAGLKSDSLISPVNSPGARVL